MRPRTSASPLVRERTGRSTTARVPPASPAYPYAERSQPVRGWSPRPPRPVSCGSDSSCPHSCSSSGVPALPGTHTFSDLLERVRVTFRMREVSFGMPVADHRSPAACARLDEAVPMRLRGAFAEKASHISAGDVQPGGFNDLGWDASSKAVATLDRLPVCAVDRAGIRLDLTLTGGLVLERSVRQRGGRRSGTAASHGRSQNLSRRPQLLRVPCSSSSCKWPPR